MVLQKAIDKAKDQSTEDKKVIAGSIAAVVVVVLVVAWGFLFLKKLQRTTQTVDLSAGAQDDFNFSSVREAQRAIQESFEYTDEELRTVRDSAVERQLPADVQGFEAPSGSVGTDQFGNYAE